MLLSRENLRNQWALGSLPGLDISHVIGNIILLFGDPISEVSCLDPEFKEKGDKYFFKNASEPIFSKIQEEYHKLGSLIPRNIDKYILITFSCIYYNLH